jgi:hypothetical protein
VIGYGSDLVLFTTLFLMTLFRSMRWWIEECGCNFDQVVGVKGFRGL